MPLERYPYVNFIQNDINMMRNFNATLIDASFCILPVNSWGPFVYSYNTYLKHFIQDMKLNLPDYQYTTKEYREQTVIKYLENYCMPGEYDLKMYKQKNVFKIHNLCIQDLYPDILFPSYKSPSDLYNKSEISRRVMKCLRDYDLMYSGWRYVDVYQEFAKVIKKGIAQNKTEFLIYPFGRNGLLFKQILNEQYGIKEKVIFDNELCLYNAKIKPISDIMQFYNERTMLILTSNKVECRRELLKYCTEDLIEGPFTLETICNGRT